MMRFRKIWDETTNGFIFAHKELVKDYKTFHALFMQNFLRRKLSHIGTCLHEEAHIGGTALEHHLVNA